MNAYVTPLKERERNEGERASEGRAGTERDDRRRRDHGL